MHPGLRGVGDRGEAGQEGVERLPPNGRQGAGRLRRDRAPVLGQAPSMAHPPPRDRAGYGGKSGNAFGHAAECQIDPGAGWCAIETIATPN